MRDYGISSGYYGLSGDAYTQARATTQMHVDAFETALRRENDRQRVLDRQEYERRRQEEYERERERNRLKSDQIARMIEAEWAAEAGRKRRELEADMARIEKIQNKNESKINAIASDPNARPANIPESREEAIAVCEYIRQNHRHPAPWEYERLTEDYRRLVQAYLDNASEHTIKGLTELCVNNWRTEIRLLNLAATQKIYAPDWDTRFEEIAVVQE